MMRTSRSAWSLVVLLALGACGSDDPASGVATLGGSDDGTPSAERTLDPEEARIAFAECMREQGVEVPDPASGAGGRNEVLVEVDEGQAQDFAEAQTECRHLLQGAFEEPSAAQMEEFQDAAVAFAQCMRDNGVEDHPDPKMEPGGTAMEISGSDVMDDPDFEQAEEKCRKLLPGAGEGVQQVAP